MSLCWELLRICRTSHHPTCRKRNTIFLVKTGKLAQKLDVPFLGEIALQENIRDTSDKGTPVVEAEPDSAAAASFLQIGERVRQALITRQKENGESDKIEINIRP